MRMRCILTVTALVWILGANFGWCQDVQPLPQQQSQQPSQQQPANNSQTPNTAGQPATPGQPIPAINPSTGTAANPESGATPADTRPLAGAEEITPELPGSSHSYILPSFSVWEGADSNSMLEPGTSKFEAATVPVGVLDMNIVGRSNQFSVNYSGGGLIYDTDWARSAWFQQGGFTDSYTTRRWSFLISDRASYLPQASGGFAGIGLAGAFNNAPFLGAGSGPGGLNPVFVPGQSVLAGQFAATSNIAIAQAQYQLNSTNSVSVTGSFGIQHFANNSNLQSGNDTLTVFSWDHQLNATDSISFSYSLIRYRYNGGTLAINDNLWRVGYGRRLSHRMSFVAMVGPQLVYTAESLVPGERRTLNFSGQANLKYNLQRFGFSLGYLHYVTPGSGVFEGANTDDVTVGATVQLTRTWDLALSAAESRNTPLAASSINPAFPHPGVVNYQYGTVRITHIMGRHLRAFMVYDLQHQASGVSFVPGSTSTGLIRHVFGIGFEMHPRPLGL